MSYVAIAHALRRLTRYTCIIYSIANTHTPHHWAIPADKRVFIDNTFTTQYAINATQPSITTFYASSFDEICRRWTPRRGKSVPVTTTDVRHFDFIWSTDAVLSTGRVQCWHAGVSVRQTRWQRRKRRQDNSEQCTHDDAIISAQKHRIHSRYLHASTDERRPVGPAARRHGPAVVPFAAAAAALAAAAAAAAHPQTFLCIINVPC